MLCPDHRHEAYPKEQRLADGANVTIGLLPHDESYTARVAHRKLTITREVTVDPDVTIAGDPRAFRRSDIRRTPSHRRDQGRRSGRDRPAAERFLSLYTLPPAVDAPEPHTS